MPKCQVTPVQSVSASVSKLPHSPNVCLLPPIASREIAVHGLRHDLMRLSGQMQQCGELLALMAGLSVTNQTARRLDDLEQRVGCLLVDLSRLRLVAEAPAFRQSATSVKKGDRA
jgi:hypothetical protein